MRDVKEEVKLALISPTHRDVMVKHLKECQEEEIEAVFDPGQQITAFSPIELQKMISQAHFVIGNDYEIKLLQEKTGWDAKEILKNTKVLITTLGGRGSIVSTADGEVVEIGTAPVKSCDDPTGAGDAYRAGLLYGIARGWGWHKTGCLAALMGSIKIAHRGGQNHKPARADIAAQFAAAFGETLD